MTELPVKSNGTYRATLWLRNPRPGRRLHNQPCHILMILDRDFTCLLGILDFLSLATILSFAYSEPCYLKVSYVITLFVFVTTYDTHSTQPV